MCGRYSITSSLGDLWARFPIQRRRCLIVADGFYEWRKDGKARHPFRFVVDDGAPFAFADVWDEWRSPESAAPLRTCSVLTTQANALVARIHDCMPVILRPEDEARWIGASITDPADRMLAFAVSTVVNSVRNDVAECVEPLVGGERLEP